MVKKQLIAAVFFCFFLTPSSFANELIPIEAFAAPASFSDAGLSPSGTKIGFLTDKDGEQVLITMDMKTKESVLIPKFGDANLLNFFWANEEVVILNYLLSHSKNSAVARRESRVVSYDISAGKFNWLGRPRKKAGTSVQKRSRFAYVMHNLPDEPDHILMGLDELVIHGNYLVTKMNVVKVNVRNGHTNEVKPGRRGITGWYADFTSRIWQSKFFWQSDQ